MFHIKAIHSPKLWESLLLVFGIVAMISVSIVLFDAVPHLPILFSILLLIGYGLLKRIPFRTLEKGLVEGAGAGMGAVFLFFFIGILDKQLDDEWDNSFANLCRFSFVNTNILFCDCFRNYCHRRGLDRKFPYNCGNSRCGVHRDG